MFEEQRGEPVLEGYEKMVREIDAIRSGFLGLGLHQPTIVVQNKRDIVYLAHVAVSRYGFTQNDTSVTVDDVSGTIRVLVRGVVFFYDGRGGPYRAG